MPKVFKTRGERKFDRSWAEARGLPPVKPGRVAMPTGGWPTLDQDWPCFAQGINPNCLEYTTVQIPLYTWSELARVGVPVESRGEVFSLYACTPCSEYRKFGNPDLPVRQAMAKVEATQIASCESKVEGWKANGNIFHCELWSGEALPEVLRQYVGATLVYADYTGLRLQPDPGPLVLTLWSLDPIIVDINSQI